MGLFFFRFWPAFIPLLAYWLWLSMVGRKATIEGRPVLRFRDGPWYWAVLASLLAALACFAYLGLSLPGSKGTYTPPHSENGSIVPGHVQ